MPMPGRTSQRARTRSVGDDNSGPGVHGSILAKRTRPRQDGVMEQSATIDIAAPPERVWDVLSDVEFWSEWTPTVTSVRRLDDGPLRPGSRAKIRQPRIPETEYVVTELDPGRSFTWVATSPGVLTTARHDAEPLPAGG